MIDWTWQSVWPAPAKLNLFLHVVGRRPDGYHLLQTAFRFIDFADELRFAPRADGAIVRAHEIPGIPVKDDLVVRATELLRRRTGVTTGVTIDLKKSLPMGGGLGGGSSDAATTLIALNHLWQTGLSRLELQSIGIQLGADVPIFIHGHSAFAEGIGDQFVDIAPPAAWYLLVMPDTSVPTAAIFQSGELRRDTVKIAPTDWHTGFGHNDLEPVACAQYPEVSEALLLLRRHGPSRMSGSGACCFAEFSSEVQARSAQEQLPSSLRSHVSPGIDLHPLRQSRQPKRVKGLTG